MKASRLLLVLLTIILVGGAVFVKKVNFTQETLAGCQTIEHLNSNKPQCWEDLIDSSLKSGGIEQAFEIFETLYASEPEFAGGCHAYAHKLGEATYQLLIIGKDFYFPEQTAFCGYGFYHGLTETLIKTKGSKEAAKLCDLKKLQITQVLYDACYHGIGHGVLSSTAQDTNVWGNVQKMINFALDQCIKATNDPIQRSRCAAGVFMELGNDYSEGKLQTASIRNDPLAICRQQQEFGKLDCYTQMYGVLNQIAAGQLKESAKFIEAIDEDNYAIEAIITLAATSLNIDKKDLSEDISTCRSLQKRLHLPCIKGFSLAYMLKGTPGKEYQDAIEFCSNHSLSDDEKSACFELILKHSKSRYSSEKLQEIYREIKKRSKNI